MYIGVGTLFCVTLPLLIRYGIGVRMCAPSMPLPAEPSTRLSRVVPHEACFVDFDVRHAVLGEEALLLGDDQRRCVGQRDEPSTAFVTSGCAAAAYSGRGSSGEARSDGGGGDRTAQHSAAGWVDFFRTVSGHFWVSLS